MTLTEIKRAVSTLTEGERAELREFIDMLPPASLSKDERLRRLISFINYVQETMTPEQLNEAVAAMNEEYIEPWDEDEWTF